MKWRKDIMARNPTSSYFQSENKSLQYFLPTPPIWQLWENFEIAPVMHKDFDKICLMDQKNKFHNFGWKKNLSEMNSLFLPCYCCKSPQNSPPTVGLTQNMGTLPSFLRNKTLMYVLSETLIRDKIKNEILRETSDISF